MALESRDTYASSEDFRDKFLSSLTPGVITRENFIQWKTIFEKTEKYSVFFDFFRQIDVDSREERISKVADAFMSADVAMDFINTAFELLGHTGKNYVSNKDYIDFKSLSKEEKNEESMIHVAEVLHDLGLFEVLEFEIKDYFVGVQVGLETHRRKNGGGAAFSVLMEKELSVLKENLNKKGFEVSLCKEEVVYFTDDTTSKTLDFCLQYGDKKIGIEINFYTASGSKPTEIKRSYGHVNKELEKVETLLVWVTDGIGYMSMKKSLKEAVDIHKNTYNFKMFQESFEGDVMSYFELV